MKIQYRVKALLIAAALAGCAHNHSATHDDHAHDESLQLTAYSSDIEVFVEVNPFVVGQPSDILAHFTTLSNFKPIAGGKVVVSLVVGEDGIRQTIEQPTREGIYAFKLKPEKEGTGRLIFDVETASGKSQLVIPNITVYTDVHDAQHAAAQAAATSSNGVTFTKEQSWKVDFATEEVKMEPFGELIRTTAQILPSQGDERVVAAKASGVVSFAGDNVVEGKSVSAGQSLFSIESSGMADNNMSVRYAEAAAEYNRAKAEYERKQELAKDKIVSQSELQNAQAAFTSAEAVYNNLRKNFSAGRQTLGSPIAGFVKQVLVKSGEYVEAGQPVMVVSQNRDLLVKAEVQPKYYSALSAITDASFKVLSTGKVYSLGELGGKVASYGRSSDLNSPLIPVMFQVKNSVGLIPGSFVELYIKTQSSSQAVAIPNGAIVEEMGSFFAFVQLTPEFFEKRAIERGSTDGFKTEILSGVSAGERVVSKGAILVKLAQASGAIDPHSGHVH